MTISPSDPTLVFSREMQVEKDLITCLVASPETAIEACRIEQLAKEHFLSSPHQAIYEAAMNLGEKAMDIHCMRAELTRLGTSSLVHDSLLAALADSIPACSNARDYAKMIREAYYRRRLSAAGETIKAYADEGKSLPEITGLARRAITETEKGLGWASLAKFSDGLDDLLHSIESGEGDGLLSCETGFPRLDNLIGGGLKHGQLCIAAGRPSMGKTVFALQIAGHTAMKQQKRVLFFSLEMPVRQLQLRMLSAMTSTPIKALQHNVGIDWPKILEARERIRNSKLSVYDKGRVTISELRAVAATYASQHHGIDLIVVDYLGLMETGRKYESRVIEVSILSAEMKTLAREYGCAVLCLCQLNRGVEHRENRRPLMSDLRDSGSIEQDADTILMLYREDYYVPDGQNAGLSEVLVTKARNAETGMITLEHDFPHQRFRNTERRMT